MRKKKRRRGWIQEELSWVSEGFARGDLEDWGKGGKEEGKGSDPRRKRRSRGKNMRLQERAVQYFNAGRSLVSVSDRVATTWNILSPREKFETRQLKHADVTCEDGGDKLAPPVSLGLLATIRQLLLLLSYPEFRFLFSSYRTFFFISFFPFVPSYTPIFLFSYFLYLNSSSHGPNVTRPVLSSSGRLWPALSHFNPHFQRPFPTTISQIGYRSLYRF